MAALSKTKIDRLGDRLKRGSPSDDDLRLLDEHRRSFSPAYDSVIGTIREKLHLDPTGRPAKSTSSIAEKLRRESIRLSQVQDIAGCRVIVTDIIAQDNTIATLRETFSDIRVMDRRLNPQPRLQGRACNCDDRRWKRRDPNQNILTAFLGRAFRAPCRRGRLKHQVRWWRHGYSRTFVSSV